MTKVVGGGAKFIEGANPVFVQPGQTQMRFVWNLCVVEAYTQQLGVQTWRRRPTCTGISRPR